MLLNYLLRRQILRNPELALYLLSPFSAAPTLSPALRRPIPQIVVAHCEILSLPQNASLGLVLGAGHFGVSNGPFQSIGISFHSLK